MKISKMFRPECSPRTGFQVLLKLKGLLIIGKPKTDFQIPGNEFRGVDGLSRIVFCKSVPDIGSNADIGLVGVRTATEKIDVHTA